MNIREQRNAAVAETIAEIRDIEQTRGVNPDALESIKGVLLKLADKRELFPEDHFPVGEEDGNSVVYRLSEDDDHRFALYASTALPGKGVHPHNHTTWAVIVGVHGDEHNIFYERADDGSQTGIGDLRQSGKFTVSHGTGVTLMPDDIHSIHVTGEKKTVHLHMYGLALEQLHERVMYDTRAGTYKIFPATQNIQQA
ncbi:MAG: hypothetical protein ISR51_01505 [Rhodospirillales bacterium]|nr:hypothetical protein [Alphaproteobacteria bacterium]MBL6947326.1 hypothetical protein [Rhodospirillales bacterium]